ncbi:MAG: hypothetical protein RSA65_04730 [Clostridia bacterium]
MNAALLKKRLAEAPRMEPVDAVKLVYQSEFGCGHLLSDETDCAARVRAELDATALCADVPAAVPIGGRLCRLNLAAPQVRALLPEQIARMMRVTADFVHGDVLHFEHALDALRVLSREEATPFPPETLEDYLCAYRAQGYPPVSHSARYRAAYAPAYRVVLSDYAVLLPVLSAVNEHLRTHEFALVVLDGDCGSGKTTLANLLAALWQTQPLCTDDFFLPFSLRTEQRLHEPGGNIHYERFADEVLSGLLRGGDFSFQRYACATGGYEAVRHPAARLTVIEGSYSHHPFFAQAYAKLDAIRVFLCAQGGEQLRRLALRSPEKLARFQSEWIPLEKNYFQAYDIKGGADLVVQSQPWENEG